MLQKGEVYVCFEGPLGACIKPEVKERIWKGEYVEMYFFVATGEI